MKLLDGVDVVDADGNSLLKRSNNGPWNRRLLALLALTPDGSVDCSVLVTALLGAAPRVGDDAAAGRAHQDERKRVLTGLQKARTALNQGLARHEGDRPIEHDTMATSLAAETRLFPESDLGLIYASASRRDWGDVLARLTEVKRGPLADLDDKGIRPPAVGGFCFKHLVVAAGSDLAAVSRQARFHTAAEIQGLRHAGQDDRADDLEALIAQSWPSRAQLVHLKVPGDSLLTDEILESLGSDHRPSTPTAEHDPFAHLQAVEELEEPSSPSPPNEPQNSSQPHRREGRRRRRRAASVAAATALVAVLLTRVGGGADTAEQANAKSSPTKAPPAVAAAARIPVETYREWVVQAEMACRSRGPAGRELQNELLSALASDQLPRDERAARMRRAADRIQREIGEPSSLPTNDDAYRRAAKIQNQLQRAVDEFRASADAVASDNEPGAFAHLQDGGVAIGTALNRLAADGARSCSEVPE